MNAVGAEQSAGTEEAFINWYNTVDRPLKNFARSLCRDPEHAKDLCQATYEKLWKAWPENHEKISATARYAKTTLHRIAIDEWRKQRLKIESMTDQSEPANQEEVFEFSDPEIADQLDAALENLSPQMRAVTALHYFEKLPFPEIAEIMGLRITTVHNYHDLAKKAVRKSLGQAKEGQNEP